MKIMCDTFNLGSITPSIVGYHIDCILMGMNLIKVPGRTGYKLFLYLSIMATIFESVSWLSVVSSTDPR